MYEEYIGECVVIYCLTGETFKGTVTNIRRRELILDMVSINMDAVKDIRLCK